MRGGRYVSDELCSAIKREFYEDLFILVCSLLYIYIYGNVRRLLYYLLL